MGRQFGQRGHAMGTPRPRGSTAVCAAEALRPFAAPTVVRMRRRSAPSSASKRARRVLAGGVRRAKSFNRCTLTGIHVVCAKTATLFTYWRAACGAARELSTLSRGPLAQHPYDW
eukprot:scaffold110806_cov75-Phaeocystis_antarctica.AAC.3